MAERRRQRHPRRQNIQPPRLGDIGGPADQRRLLSPEVQRPAHARLDIAHPAPGTAIRRRQDIFITETAELHRPVEIDLRLTLGLRARELGFRAANARHRRLQSRIGLQQLRRQPVGLGIVEGFPPVFRDGRRLFVRQAQILRRQLRHRRRHFLRHVAGAQQQGTGEERMKGLRQHEGERERLGK